MCILCGTLKLLILKLLILLIFSQLVTDILQVCDFRGQVGTDGPHVIAPLMSFFVLGGD